MSDLQTRQEKIKERRKQTPRRDYLMEIASRWPANMYKNEGVISVFPPTDRCGNITSTKEYLAKYTDQMVGDEYSTEDFFKSFQKLFLEHIKPSAIQFGENENSDFGNCIFRAKNAYLSFVVGEQSENIFYSSIVYMNCNNVLNSLCVTSNSQNIYTSKIVTNSFNIFFSSHIHNCSNIRYSDNLTGCHDCVDCSGLENASYMIGNVQHTKESYETQKKQLLRTHDKQLKIVDGANRGSNNSTGQGIFLSNNIQDGYSVSRLDGGKNVCFVEGTNGCKNFVDVFEAGINSQDFYGVCSAGTNISNIYCSTLIDQGGSNIYYSYHLESCSFCLGCIGLKNKQFCIFNKEYNKEERHKKVDEIFTQMEAGGTLGQFFPGSMNPFYFNDTAAYLIDDTFTKEEVGKEGYMWRDEPIKVDIPTGAEVVEVKDLASYEGFNTKDEREINPEILKKVIKDEKGNYYRIVKMEYDFLVKHGLPLPQLHRLERIKSGFKFK